jgi:SAM-dependent methyltransferase
MESAMTAGHDHGQGETKPNPNDPAFWDKAVASYEEQAQPFTQMYAVDALSHVKIGPETRVLDVATGTGAAAIEAARRGGQVTAIDFSRGMVERVTALNHPRIAARVMDGQALDLADVSFDVVVSVFGVMLFPDWRKGLAEMARVTRPGGSAVVATWKGSAGAGINLLLEQTCRRLFPEFDMPAPPCAGLVELGDLGRLGAAVSEAGFGAPMLVEATRDFGLRTSTLDDAERLLATNFVWMAMEKAQRGPVLEEVKAIAARDGRDGLLLIPSTALIAVAVRP